MKKIIAILLLACMVLALAACGAKTETPAQQTTEQTTEETTTTEETAAPEETATEETTPEETAAAANYKLGMGVEMKVSETSAQIDASTAAVVLDAEGKIVAVRIDVAQDKMDVTDGQVDTAAAYRTKKELKEDYGMNKIGAKEWYIQAAAFEEYVLGKTVEEIEAMELVVNESGHEVTTDEELYASCSISIGEFKAAVIKACRDEQGMEFTADGEFSLGLAIISSASGSVAATAEEDGTVKMYSNYAAVVVGADGKILAALTDATQPNITINTAGEVVATSYVDTKRELKEDYGMSKIGAVEWYIQARNFVEFVVGKTAEELRAVELVEDGDHTVFADEELRASCSISVKDMVDVVALAADYAVA